jgi:site-specific recombinase
MAKTDSITLKLSLGADSEHWLESLASSLRIRGKKSADEKLEAYYQAVSKRPGLAEELRQSAWSFLDERSIRSLLCESGINWSHNFFDSLASRMLGKVLPPPPREGNLQNSVRQAFDRTSDHLWLCNYSDRSLQRLSELFDVALDHPTLQKFRIEILASLEILSHRLAAMGLDKQLIQNAPELEKYVNPFLVQSHELIDLMKALDGVGVTDDAQEDVLASKAEAASDAHLNVLLQQCEEIVSKVQRQTRSRGTSLHLTYHLGTIQDIIVRMQTLSAMITGRLSRVERWRFFVSLCIAENRRHSVNDLFKQHSRAIAVQVVRQAGHTGGHYIAQTAPQLKKLFVAALGGGMVVGGIAMVKALISQLSLPPVVLMLGYCGNYALGFILLHLLGFTLATKQPAMTAAALAASMPDQHGKVRNSSLDGVADLCLMTARSQFAAIVGNVIVAFPVAYLISCLWQAKWGVPLASPEKAQHLMTELDPFHTPALLYAGVAGVGLFLSGLVSGYFDNLSDFYAIPDRIRHSPMMLAALGKRVEVWARLFENETGALFGNAALGIYLGVMSALGPTVGIPLDIRHVTFSAANLGFAVHAQGLHWSSFAIGLAGVAGIGFVNLFVSFGLALWTAASARGIGKRNAFRLLQALHRRFRDKTEESISAVSQSLLDDATRKTPALPPGR